MFDGLLEAFCSSALLSELADPLIHHRVGNLDRFAETVKTFLNY